MSSYSPLSIPPPELAGLLRKYDRPGPRYTSYPTAVEFAETFAGETYREYLKRADAQSDTPLSAYVHLPFCDSRCSFCGCNVIILPDHARAAGYLDDLADEFALVAGLLPRRRRVAQFHFGGGTPTYQSPEELARVYRAFTALFEMTPEAEIACEVDPRSTTLEHLDMLRALGFNRVSMGVQDFTPEVQQIIRRNQTEEETRRIFQACRERNFHSINMDLVYGLPLQRLETFDRTLEAVVELRPDRVAVYSFAHVPWLRANQKLLDPKTLPPPELKIELFALAMRRFLDAGYVKIGMDHFALPEDELSRALGRHALYRNFMGYTVQPPGDMLGFGISAIGNVQGAFAQNTKKLTRYRQAIRSGIPPVERGYALTRDDELRGRVILEIMCNFRVDFAPIEVDFGIRAAEYFAREFVELEDMEREGFLVRGPDHLRLTDKGSLFVRNVAMVFDAHLRRRRAEQPMFSRTV